MAKYVQSEPFRNQYDVQSMILCTREAELDKLRDALTAVLSTSRPGSRAPPGSSSGTAVANEEAA